MARIRIGLAVVAALVAASASAEIYRWRDAQGVEHFTTDLYQVPAKHRAAAEAAASGASGGSYNSGGGEAPATESAPATPSAPEPDPRRGVGGPRSPGAASPAKDAGELVGGRDEAWWRAQQRDYLDRIAKLETRAEACEGMSPAVKYNPNTGWRAKEQHYERKSAALDDCAEAKSHLDASRLGLEKFEENARRQGVPPGWLR